MYTGTKPDNIAFHFIAGDKLRDGSTAPRDGEWLYFYGPIQICHSGLHASYRVTDALKYAPGETLCLVEIDNIRDRQEDKIVCTCRKIIARFDATELLRACARESAKSVLKNWQGPVPRVVRDWLNTGDEKYRIAAESAAESAARSAAWSAARSAAENAAAKSAAWSAADSARGAAYSAADSASGAAWSAAWSAADSARGAAWSAAHSAAKGAAWSAARSAVENAAAERLHNAVMAKFIEMGVLQ